MKSNSMVMFHEVQRFRNTWAWWLVLTISIGSSILISWLYCNDDNITAALGAGIISLGAFFIGFGVLHIMKLEISITPKEIQCCYFPFIKKRIYNQNNLTNLTLRKYSPISEFGGWGIKYSISGKGWVYNVQGNEGIQLYLSNNKRVLIGTQKAEKLKPIIERLKKEWGLT